MTTIFFAIILAGLAVFVAMFSAVIVHLGWLMIKSQRLTYYEQLTKSHRQEEDEGPSCEKEDE